MVTIDVRETEAAAQSDESILIRPGTDAALALAMMHVIIAEGLHDAEFVARHTVGFDALAAHVAAARARVGGAHHRDPGRAHRRARPPLRDDAARR